MAANQGDVVIAWEPWATMWPKAEPFARLHFDEVEGELARKRPFGPVIETWAKLDEIGVLKIVTAHIRGALVGYCMWTVSPDIKSFGTMKAEQGPIYVDDAAAPFGLGYKMLKFSIAGLHKMGVKLFFLHHKVRGRGKRLWMWFKRLGAVKTQEEYFLWIGD